LERTGNGWVLEQAPVREIQALRSQHQHRSNFMLRDGALTLKPLGMTGHALEVQIEFRVGTAREFGLKVAVGPSQQTLVGYDVDTHSVFVDRRRSGNAAFSASFAARHSAPLQPINGRIKLHVFVDAASVEVFANDGERVLTEQIFPEPVSTGVELYAVRGDLRVLAVDLWQLQMARVQ
jgi:fructan beta-fructosidase